MPKKSTEQAIYDIIIIGAGAAGLTSAIYALRARKSVLIFEKNAIGGQILPAEKISNYPGLPDVSGQTFATNLKSQVKSLGGVFALESVESVAEKKPLTPQQVARSPESAESSAQTDQATPKNHLFSVTSDDSTYLSRAIIIANGSAEKKLDLPGERELTGRGLSYCATCDGALYSGATVAVYGGGATAVSSALYLSGLAEKVYLIHRSNRFRADQKLLDLLDSTPNLEIRHNSELVRLKSSVKNPTTSEDLKSSPKNPLGAENLNPALSAIVIKNTRTPDDPPLTLPVSALFVNIGRTPDNKIFSNLVDLDPSGYILSSEACLTRTPGVFCAGDTRKKPLNQLVTATADGATAATAALAYLREN